MPGDILNARLHTARRHGGSVLAGVPLHLTDESLDSLTQQCAMDRLSLLGDVGLGLEGMEAFRPRHWAKLEG